MKMVGQPEGETRDLPELSDVSRLLSSLNPLDGPKALARALNTTFPSKDWHVKDKNFTWSSTKVSIVQADGSLVSANAEDWLKQQVRLVGSDTLIHGLKQAGFLLERREGETVYALGLGPNPLNFIQMRISIERRALCSLKNIESGHLRGHPHDDDYGWNSATRSAPIYSCAANDMINSLNWLERCELSQYDEVSHRLKRLEHLTVTRAYADGSKSVEIPFLEAHPLESGWINQLWAEQRWFDDWRASSAGKSPMGLFWYLETQDYVYEGVHYTRFIPQAVIWPKARIRARDKSKLALIDRLARFDQAVRCPFGWFFYMVHGNRISADVGMRIADGVGRGEIHLAPRDEAVLMAWADKPYGF